MSDGFGVNATIGLFAMAFAVRWLIMWIQGRSKEIAPAEYFVWSAIGVTMLIAIIFELAFR